eukprot:4654868-Amphidinium_carterae.1
MAMVPRAGDSLNGGRTPTQTLLTSTSFYKLFRLMLCSTFGNLRLILSLQDNSTKRLQRPKSPLKYISPLPLVQSLVSLQVALHALATEVAMEPRGGEQRNDSNNKVDIHILKNNQAHRFARFGVLILQEKQLNTRFWATMLFPIDQVPHDDFEQHQVFETDKHIRCPKHSPPSTKTISKKHQ